MEKKIDGNTSDGFHTFNELYEFRLLLTAHTFNNWNDANCYGGVHVFRSKRHSDGTIPFNDPNWFIVVATTPFGQISFHYEMKDWDLFYNCHEVEKAPEYDGHTSADVLERLRKMI